MYLKRLVIQGFKSFPEKINLNFTKGITAVVGPNGSGKSNISDAVRWVLGEQSAKSLRGGKMEDIIFAGTQSRKPLGFAEVSLIIDNEDSKMSMDFSEITITRRVYRSGESEFRINGVNCRLRDIHELFMDTGIGREGYSIIGQGRIDEILSSKGDDRRFLFEEATGIVKFRTRRDEALLKLQHEKQNITRLEDIIDELEIKLEPLLQQSEIAKKYMQLVDRLKTLRVNIFLTDAKKTEQLLKNLSENIVNINLQSDTENNKKLLIETKIIELKKALTIADLSYNNANDEQGNLRSEIEQNNNDIKLINEKNNYIEKDILRLKKEGETLDTSTQLLLSEKKTLEQQLLQQNSILSENITLLKENEQEFEKLNEQIIARENKSEKFNADIIEQYKYESELNYKTNNLKSMYERLEERKEQLNSIYSTLLISINENEQKEQIHTNQLNEIKNKQNFLKKEIELLENNKIILNKNLNQAKFKNDTISKHLNDAISKYKIIKELKDDFEGYFGSVKAILRRKNTDNTFAGIIGAVGELIDVPPKFETAIETALGNLVQNIITETENDAKTAINYLKNTKQGRATFLPISVIKGRTFQDENDILNNNGVLGIGYKIVNFDPKYKNIIENLLGRTVIIDTIENGIILSQKYKNSFKIVTLSGDLLNIGGSLTGGSIMAKSTSIFGRARQINELSELIQKTEKEIEITKQEEIKFSDDFDKILDNIETKKIVSNDNEIQIQFYIQNLNTIKDKLNDYLEKENDYKTEDKQLMEQIIETNKNIRANEENLLNITKNIQNIKTKMQNFQNTTLIDKESKDSRINILTNIKIKISSVKQSIQSTEENIGKNSIEIKNILQKFQNIKEEIKEQHISFNNNLVSINDNKTKTEMLLVDQKEKLTEIANISKQKEEISKEIEINELLEKQQLELISNIEKEKTRLELKKEQTEEDRRKLYDTMWEEYEMTYQQALKYPIEEEGVTNLYKKESAVKNEIRQLGSVNTAAIDEYKGIKERYDFLTSQRDDILTAEENLKQLIVELTELMSARFVEQFNIISKNFNEVFYEMFEGGKANLKLSDPSNILESEIEIVAQPPGKNLQNMSLLSGGERALTAIALLFGILKMKPSPFCILDEIEAALDEANVKRFADFIKRLSTEIQFIIITHRKGTMESADVLYGVTMEQHGISKLVSVELEQSNAMIN